MEKKIYIFEVSNAPHETSIMSTIELFSKLGFRTYLCLNDISEDRFKKLNDDKHFNIINFNKVKGYVKFFMTYKKNDFVLYNTVSFRSIFIVFFISIFASKNIYYIRNANSWIYRPNHAKKIFHIVFGHLIYFIKRHLLKGAFVLACGSYTIKDFLDQKTIKKSFVIPFNSFYQKKIINHDNREFTFVVPGNIDLSRKNLRIIKEASLLFSNSELDQFKIILLGRPISNTDKDFIEKWKNEIGDSLVYYSNFIPAIEFDKILRNANVILGVVNINYSDRFNKEIYGQTKDTGIEAHAIAYSKPLMINSDYMIESRLLVSTLLFTDSRDCFMKMKKMLNVEEYKKLLKNAYMTSKFYSIENLSLELKNVIEL